MVERNRRRGQLNCYPAKSAASEHDGRTQSRVNGKKSQIEGEIERLVESNEYRIRQKIESILNQEWRLLRSVPWEEFLLQILECHGFDAEMTKTSGDQGVDLLARKNGISIAIQAKGYADNVGNSAVQQAYTGMKIYECSHCAVITNSELLLPQTKRPGKPDVYWLEVRTSQLSPEGNLNHFFELQNSRDENSLDRSRGARRL